MAKLVQLELFEGGKKTKKQKKLDDLCPSFKGQTVVNFKPNVHKLKKAETCK